MAEMFGRSQVADEHAVRFRPLHDLEIARFRGFLDAGRRQEDGTRLPASFTARTPAA